MLTAFAVLLSVIFFISTRINPQKDGNIIMLSLFILIIANIFADLAIKAIRDYGYPNKQMFIFGNIALVLLLCGTCIMWKITF